MASSIKIKAARSPGHANTEDAACNVAPPLYLCHLGWLSRDDADTAAAAAPLMSSPTVLSTGHRGNTSA
ncbi:hypothetical protein CH63R_13119 [Colletotrichum higginsianum IMI 349063]|uniref:Uncharacterized protein n=1 Tax=Colletotrichum higginsianum (strain IMI 349063) TaxID=759273 RepID=A0A1B7XW25_COLHI|nr:hypothetical protein CH63R_13119 [Colletotrichum higginsianum IMI 349063]OBR03992.1 hypothetical protein CH63R_13119 [Colletotrichum higginsianum IMI 349063]